MVPPKAGQFMSASLAVLLPVILLGIVAAFCFVGCGFSPAGQPLNPWTTYGEDTVLANPAVVAYWPLGEFADSVPAEDLSPNPVNGQYIDQVSLPAIYPWPAYSVPNLART